jgi:hypothetical protein
MWLHRSTRTNRTVALLTLALACLMLVDTPAAVAVTAQGGFAVTVTPATAMYHASYSIGRFRTATGETVTGCTFTFPEGTDASAATSAGNTISVDPLDKRTVTITFGSPVTQRKNFSVDVGNVINPSTGGTYAITEITFLMDAGDQVVPLGIDGEYTIDAPPYLTFSVGAADGSQTISFTGLDPGVTSAPADVTIKVNSGAPFTITRTYGGEYVPLALAITSTMPAEGTVLPALAPQEYVDSYTVTPDWTVDPEVVVTATVTYTVVQQIP